jgi:hypothetical protein
MTTRTGVAKKGETPRKAFAVFGPQTGSMRARTLKGEQAHERMISSHASGSGNGSFGKTTKAGRKL